MNTNFSKKRILIVALALIVAILHIIGPGKYASRTVSELYFSYFSDLMLPFMVYFLLCNVTFLPEWWQKAAVPFGMATAAEILQFFGVYALGNTFDPLDIVAYATGTLVAVFVEQFIFAKYLKFWND